MYQEKYVTLSFTKFSPIKTPSSVPPTVSFHFLDSGLLRFKEDFSRDQYVFRWVNDESNDIIPRRSYYHTSVPTPIEFAYYAIWIEKTFSNL